MEKDIYGNIVNQTNPAANLNSNDSPPTSQGFPQNSATVYNDPLLQNPQTPVTTNPVVSVESVEENSPTPEVQQVPESPVNSQIGLTSNPSGSKKVVTIGFGLFIIALVLLGARIAINYFN